MLYDSTGIEYQLSRLEQYQEEFELFKSMCISDIREMRLVSEGASEEELTSFREEESKGIILMQESLLDTIKNKLQRAKIKFTSNYPIPKKAVDIDLSEYKKNYVAIVSPAKYSAKLNFIIKSLNSVIKKGPSFCNSSDIKYYNRKIAGTDEEYINDVIFDYKNNILPAHIVKEYLDLVATHKLEEQYNKFSDDINSIFDKLSSNFKDNADITNYTIFIEAVNNILIGVTLFYEDLSKGLKLISKYIFEQEKD